MSRFFVFCSALAAALLALAGCGYVGPVQPPSLHIPLAVSDLSAEQVGGAIEIAFTLPGETTDQTTITRFHRIELKVGPEPEAKPFDFNSWAAEAKTVAVDESELTQVETGRQRASVSTPIETWQGKEIAIAVRTAQRGERFSQWSNVVRLRVVRALETPSLQLEPDRKGVKVTMTPEQQDAHYRVLRTGPNDAAPVEAGTTDSNEFIDEGVEYGTKYRYTVVAFNDREGANARSKESEPAEITPVDTFPPAAPAHVTVLAGPASVEVSWERSADNDVKSYNVYRAVNDGAWEKVAEGVELPTYSDKNVQSGKRYRYQISAVDLRNNEGDHSEAAEVNF